MRWPSRHRFTPKKFNRAFRYSCCWAIIALLSFLIFNIQQQIFFSQTTVSIPKSSEPLQLYSNQTDENLTTLYVQTIQSAKKSITFLIYALTDKTIIKALKAKEEAGVAIHLVCDADATPSLAQHFPRSKVVRRKGTGLMHQKILVIDEMLILLGSANMTSDSLTKHGNLVIGLSHPPLASLIASRAKEMRSTGKIAPIEQLQTSCADQPIELYILPKNRNAEARVRSLLATAKKTIRVAMFTWTRQDFTQELIHAAKRGVKVEAIVDRQSAKGTSAAIVKTLYEAGIAVKLSSSTTSLLHHKFAYIDESILINGSANWTLSAFSRNDDCFMIIYDLNQSQREKMGTLWNFLKKHSEFVKEN